MSQQGEPTIATAATQPAVLSSDQINTFIRDGVLIQRQTFTSDLAARIVPMVWTELGMDPRDRSAWKQKMIILEKVLDAPPVQEIYSPHYLSVIDDLCGGGRWRTTKGAGYWPILFPGFASPPWHPPKGGWHADGAIGHTCLGEPARGLVGLELYTRMEHGDGGTSIRVGSHHETAIILKEAGSEGLSAAELERRAVAASRHRPVYEVTGEPGDVIFLHPYTIHASSPNTGSRVRMLGNKPVWLHEPMQLSRPQGEEYSPVERAVVEALQA